MDAGRRGGSKGRDKGRHAGDGRRRTAVRRAGGDAEERAPQWLPAQWRAQPPGGRHGARRRRVWRMRLRRYAQACLANLAGRPEPVSPQLVGVICSIAEPPCLPPGHPERAVPEVPPSPVECELWADLIGYGRG